MTPLLNYVIQVIIVSGLLYGYYHWVLRNKKFHHYNRYYLLGAALLSILIPLINIPVYFTQEQTSASFVYSTLTVFSGTGEEEGVTLFASIPEKVNWFTWDHILPLIYITVAAIVFLRIVFSLLKIRRIIRQHPVEKIDQIRFLNTDEPGTPYSFFRWLFWNRKIELNSAKGEQIFRHELFHIEQKHSLDILFFELLTVAGWFNPFFHLMKKETRAIHEFLADQFAVTENNRWDYAELLLMQVLNTNQRLVHPFFHNQIKRRIAMITSPQKTSHQYLRKLMVLPLALLSVILFAFSYKEIRKVQSVSQIPVMINKADTTIKPDKEENRIYSKVEATYPGGMDAWRKHLQRNLNAGVPIQGKAPAGVYTVVIQFMVNLDGSVSDAKPLTHHGYGMETEAIRVIKSGANWIPAIQNGRKVKAYRKQPITFVVDSGPRKEGNVNAGEGKTLNEVVMIGYNDQTATPEKENIIFEKVETEPGFPGGSDKWKEYLQKNCNGAVATDNGAPEGKYTVLVQFLVDKEGNISNIQPLTNHGYGMEPEVVRLISNGPKWISAVQNGKKVRAYKKQPVTFIVSDRDNEPHESKSGAVPEITLSKLKTLTVMEALGLPAGTDVISFIFTIDLDNGEIFEIRNTGNSFNKATIQQFTNTKPGRLMTFDFIKIRINGEERKSASRVYKVVP